MNATAETDQFISSKEAVRIARAFLYEHIEQEKLKNLLLEEIEFSEGDDTWLITFGFDTGRTITTQTSVEPPYSLLGQGETVSNITEERAYKLVKVHATDGRVDSMTIRRV